MKIKIKPLTVNRAWRGKRFKTPEYRDYERELWYLLPNQNIPQGKLELTATVGYSNKGSDIDNFLKPFLDILQKKYLFNDSMIYKLVIDKQIVDEGQEFINFEIKKYECL